VEPPATKLSENVPDAPVPLTGADPTMTLAPEGLATWTKTAVPVTSPDPAVTLPETVNDLASATELGDTVTETESGEAATIKGAANTSDRTRRATVTVFRGVDIRCRPSKVAYLACRGTVSAPKSDGDGRI
jgi:hypothetical protein